MRFAILFYLFAVAALLEPATSLSRLNCRVTSALYGFPSAAVTCFVAVDGT